MTLAPLLTAAPAVQIHAIAAFGAIALTLLIFTRPRGTRTHRWLGRAWVAVMASVALSSLLITYGPGFEGLRLGGFSIIHLLSLYVLAGLVLAVRAARRGDIGAHRKQMTGMVWGSLVVAGAFTLLPGRIMHAVLIGG